MTDQPSQEEGAAAEWPLWLPALFLLGYLGFAYGPLLWRGQLLASGDSLAYYFPIRVLVAEAYSQGVMPFWNPYAFGGFPLWSPFQSGALYLGNLPFLFLPPVLAMNLTVVGAYALAGGLTYGLGRSLGWGRSAATLAALAWMGSGFMVARLEHLTTLQVASLLPGLFWGFHKLLQAPSLPRFALSSLVVAGMVFAGHPQFMIQGSLLALAWALHQAWPKGWKGLAQSAAWCGGSLVVGSLLAWVQVQPMLALLGEGSRTQLSYENFIAQALNFRHALTFVFPFFFGGQVSSLYPIPYWGVGPFHAETMAYPGLMVVLLALASLPLALKHRGQAFWHGAALGAFILCLAPGPLFQLLHHLPVLNTLRVPARNLMEVNFALALLAGQAWQSLGVAPAQRLGIRHAVGGLWAGMVLLLGLLAWAGPQHAVHLQTFVPAEIPMAKALQWMQPAMLLPLVVALASGAGLLLWAHKPKSLALLGPLVLLLDLLLFQRFAGPWQLASAPNPEGLTTPAWPGRGITLLPSAYPFRDHPLTARLGLPHLNVFRHEEQVGGAEGFFHTRRQKLLANISPYGHLNDAQLLQPKHLALDLLAVTWLRCLPEQAQKSPWREALKAPRWRAQPSPEGLLRFENRQALPRAWAVNKTRQAPARVVDQMVSQGGFDPREEAWLDSDGPAPASSSWHPKPTLRWQRIDLNTMVLNYESPGPCFVLLAEAFDPGWEASSPTEKLPVHRVNGLIMGMALPPGKQEIRLQHKPVGWVSGLSVSLATALALLLMGLLGRRRCPPEPAFSP